MSDYKFCGINVWTYSEARAIVWLGFKHYSDYKRYLMLEFSGPGCLGAEFTVGGENREVTLRLGLLLFTAYISLTGIVPNRYEKAKMIATQEQKYAYELDYSSEGRTTGVMARFTNPVHIHFSFWKNGTYWSSKPLREKYKRFPYCEGASRSFYLTR